MSLSSGGYWVKRVKQLPLGLPLFENIAYSFILLYIFFKDHYEIVTKSGKPQNEFIGGLFFIRDHYEVGTKSGKYEIDSK